MTSGTAARRLTARQDKLADVRDQQAAAALRRRRLGLGAWMVGLLVIAGLVTAALLSSRPVQSSAARGAPDFSLPTSVGGTLRLSSLRGAPVLLYFSEGAGCDACLVQMAEIEKNPGFAKAGIRVVPIVMNSASQINADAKRLGVQTPFLLDGGAVSKAYGTIGTGMHANLPGHGFVLIDAKGVQRWYGNYPSMWITPQALLDEVLKRL